MHGEYRESRAGFTLVEILVVLAIVAVVSAIAIPGLAKMGAFSRDEFKRATQEVNSVLRAAQLYATTYNVNTAVVYSMDHYSEGETQSGAPEPITSPIVDSLTGVQVRQIEAAAIMYQLPTSMPSLSDGQPNPLKGCYVPIAGDKGEFTPLPQGMSIMLQNPESAVMMPGSYDPIYSEFAWSNYGKLATVNRVGSMGLDSLTVAFGVPPELTPLDLDAFLQNSANYTKSAFIAHVFRSSGRLSVPDRYSFECGDCNNIPANCGICDHERFSLYIAPSADRPLEERVVQPENPSLTYNDSNGVEQSNLRYREIHIFKSTGRIAIPQDF